MIMKKILKLAQKTQKQEKKKTLRNCIRNQKLVKKNKEKKSKNKT
jgi:hypothetical protein